MEFVLKRIEDFYSGYYSSLEFFICLPESWSEGSVTRLRRWLEKVKFVESYAGMFAYPTSDLVIYLLFVWDRPIIEPLCRSLCATGFWLNNLRASKRKKVASSTTMSSEISVLRTRAALFQLSPHLRCRLPQTTSPRRTSSQSIRNPALPPRD